MAAPTSVVWFRRDLRVADHPALAAATAAAGDDGRIVPLFVVDPALVRSPRMAPARLRYLCDALADLDRSLRARGARLVVRTGDPREEVPRVVAEAGAVALHHGGDVTPYALGRDALVRAEVERLGAQAYVHETVYAARPRSLRKDDGGLHRVFTPWYRAWKAAGVREELPAPAHLAVPGSVSSEDVPTTASLRVGAVPPGTIRGGEAAARARLATFLRTAAAGYAEGRNAMGRPGTSRLSADLHYGCLSPVTVLRALDRRRRNHERFAMEVAWRDFYGHVMAAWPHVRDEELNPAMRGVPWRRGGPELEAWKAGRTGYPIVDAGMRQLLEEAWMHNRARMVVGSFLCKDLLVDWRVGQEHFLRHLVDGDVASNNGGWQWIAGTGTDPQPFFRIFNPVLQGERFDPDGAYVRRYVPELRDVPDGWIHRPWEMPEEVARAAGVRLGTDYPWPIVDHAEARRRALDVLARHRDPAQDVHARVAGGGGVATLTP